METNNNRFVHGVSIAAAIATILSLFVAVLVLIPHVPASSGATTNQTTKQNATNTVAANSAAPSSRSILIGWSNQYSTELWNVWVTYRNFTQGSYTFTCNYGNGDPVSYHVVISANPQTVDDGNVCHDEIPGDTIWITGGSAKSNDLTVPSGPTILIGWSNQHPTYVSATYHNFPKGTYSFTCNFRSKASVSFTAKISRNPQTIDDGTTCADAYENDAVLITYQSVKSNAITVPPTYAQSSLKTIQIGWSNEYATYVWVKYFNFPTGTYTYTCNFGSGGSASYVVSIYENPQTIDDGATCYDSISGDTVWITIDSVKSNVLTVP